MQTTTQAPKLVAVTPCDCGRHKKQRWHLICPNCHNQLTTLMQQELNEAYRSGWQHSGFHPESQNAQLVGRIRHFLRGGAVTTVIHFESGAVWRLDRFGRVVKVSHDQHTPHIGNRLHRTPRIGHPPLMRDFGWNYGDIYNIGIPISQIDVLELEVAA